MVAASRRRRVTGGRMVRVPARVARSTSGVRQLAVMRLRLRLRTRRSHGRAVAVRRVTGRVSGASGAPRRRRVHF